MALAALSLCHCSSSITTFLPSNSRQPSTFSPHLQTQPFISPLTKSQPPNSSSFLFQFRPSIHCRCTSNKSNVGFQFVSLVSLFQEIGISFKETKSLLSNASELSSIQLDSLHGRILYLQSLGFLKNELQGQLKQATVKLLLSKKLSDFPHKVQLLLDRGIAVDKIEHVLNKVDLSKAICHRSMEEIERVISFLKPFGGVDLIVKHPAILNHDFDCKLKPRIRVFTELSGGDEDSVGKVLNKFPVILNLRVEHVETHIEFLRSFAELDDQQIFKIVLVFPAILSCSRERKLRPRIQFLKDCGLDSGEIFKFLINAPVFLAISFRDNLANRLVFLVKIGYEYRTKELPVAIAISSRMSCKNMQKTVSVLLNYGFSPEETFAMTTKKPRILQYNHASLEKKMKYLTEEMNRDIKELLNFPAFLGYNLDERIKHRYEIKKGSREGQMSLSQLLYVSTEKFQKRLLKNPN
ncbi:unnamed protein product [Vicia faba]|uniref:Uncharacterized protein n=1 Tax=Vicia faba TaxID=3906 RepID=A0AAV0YFL2_VICFA|nr:unnamed protein product [Vicia faba]